MSSLLMAHFEGDQWPWEDIAREELNDKPELRAEKLAELVSKIKKYKEKHPKFHPQLDEPFLVAFLRTRKYNVDKAFKSYIEFYKIRLCNPGKLFPVGKGPKDFAHVIDRRIALVLNERNPIDGSLVVIWSFRYFNAWKDELEDTFNITLHGALEALVDPSFQTYGVRFIFDLTGASLMLGTMFMTRMYYVKALVMMQGAFPARFKGFHVINDPYGLVKPLYPLVWPFLSSKMRQRVHMHGSKLDGLYDHVAREILPEEFGGSAGPMGAVWFRDILELAHDDIVRKSYFGYIDAS